ncbi:hypothetical protein AAY473_011743 [Plecturocebus cupreus]
MATGAAPKQSTELQATLLNPVSRSGHDTAPFPIWLPAPGPGMLSLRRRFRRRLHRDSAAACPAWLLEAPSNSEAHFSTHNRIITREMKTLSVAQAGLELLGSSDPHASASQSAGITGVRHHTQSRGIRDPSERTRRPSVQANSPGCQQLDEAQGGHETLQPGQADHPPPGIWPATCHVASSALKTSGHDTERPQS